MPQQTFKDLTGKMFDCWTVLRRAPNDKRNRTTFFCRCECGNEVIVDATSLKSGRSHGCQKCSPSRKDDFHGMSQSKTYSVYIQMIERCHNTNHASYHNYGGRGIFVCKRWQEGFKNFIEDMGEAPQGLSIDRIDNDSGYFKENCRWTTRKVQSQNRRNAIHIGEIHNEWEILDYHHIEKKTYLMKCINCDFTRKIKSCNFRRMRKHECNQRNLYE